MSLVGEQCISPMASRSPLITARSIVTATTRRQALISCLDVSSATLAGPVQLEAMSKNRLSGTPSARRPYSSRRPGPIFGSMTRSPLRMALRGMSGACPRIFVAPSLDGPPARWQHFGSTKVSHGGAVPMERQQLAVYHAPDGPCGRGFDSHPHL